MTLPDLPKQIKKREAEFGAYLVGYLRKYPMKSAPLELKQTTQDSISFDCITTKQIAKLREAKSTKGTLDKFSDTARGYKPYDSAWYRKAPAFIVIRFPHEFHFIDIDIFMQQKKLSARKSLTVEVARQISSRYGKI